VIKHEVHPPGTTAAPSRLHHALADARGTLSACRRIGGYAPAGPADRAADRMSRGQEDTTPGRPVRCAAPGAPRGTLPSGKDHYGHRPPLLAKPGARGAAVPRRRARQRQGRRHRRVASGRHTCAQGAAMAIGQQPGCRGVDRAGLPYARGLPGAGQCDPCGMSRPASATPAPTGISSRWLLGPFSSWPGPRRSTSSRWVTEVIRQNTHRAARSARRPDVMAWRRDGHRLGDRRAGPSAPRPDRSWCWCRCRPLRCGYW
jgi:hypothetical protein